MGLGDWLKLLVRLGKFKTAPAECQKHVYTDGSAFCGDKWDCCLAGAAVVQWIPQENKMKEVVRKILPYQDHNSYRAEVFAIILAMECFWKIDIFSGCEAVLYI